MTSTPSNSLEKAIELGEYQPEFLGKYPEWSGMSSHMQFEFIRRGIDNRRQHLRREYASIVNQPDFSKKNHLKVALQKIVTAQKELIEEEELLQLEYAGK